MRSKLLFTLLFTVCSPFLAINAYAAKKVVPSPELSECEALLGTLSEDALARALGGERLYSEDAKNFALDGVSLANLEMTELMIKPIMDLAPTELGRARIKYMFQHPYLDIEHIRERQLAVTELMQHPQFLQDGHAELKNLGGGREKCLGEMSKKLGGPIHQASKSYLATAYGLSACVLGMGGGIGAVAMYGGSVKIGMVLALKFYAMMPLAIMQVGPNETAVAARNLFSVGKNLHDKFPIVKSRELLQLKEILSWPNRSDDPLELKSVRNAIERLGPTRVGLGAQAFSYTSGLIQYLGWRKLQRLQKNLAIYLSAVAEFESYLAAAKFLSDAPEGTLRLPTLLDSPIAKLSISEGNHPYQALTSGQVSVANDYESTASGGTKTHVLTGPNAGGKTTYLRMVGQLIAMAQMGFPVPARAMELTPMRIITNFQVIDSTARGDSTFRSQSKRIKEIMTAVGPTGGPVFAALDEILTGTSKSEHRAAEQAVVEALHEDAPNLISIVATHDRRLADLEALPGLANIHVSLEGFKILPGASKDYNAFDVMEAAEVPAKIVNRARRLHELQNPKPAQ